MFIALLVIAIILLLVFVKYWWVVLLIVLGIYLASLVLPRIGELLFMLVDDAFDFFEGLFIHGHGVSVSNNEVLDDKKEIANINYEKEEPAVAIVNNTNCPNCAARILPGAKECDYCGTRFVR